MFTSEESHYSYLMAANVIGIGYDNVIKVVTDENGSMDTDKLVEAIAKAKEDGKTPLCVGATAGTTVRGAYDPMRKIAAICKENGIWFHIDAAWGG